MKPDPATPVSCEAFQAALQRFLDGQPDAFASGDDAHRSACAACRADFRAAVRLQEGLRGWEKPVLEASLTDRMASAVLADMARPRLWRRVVERRWTALVAVAACLLLAIGIGVRLANQPERDQPAPSPEIAATAPTAAPVALDGSLAEAGSAVASLTRRTATQTIEPARRILASAADSPGILADPVPDAVGPANQSLARIRDGAAMGLEPVANSARRAVSLFLRDLPVEGERKPGF